MKIKKRNLKQISVILLVIVLLTAGYFLFFAKPDYPEINTPKPVFGNPDAEIEITEFSDLQCPACGSAYLLVEEIKEEYENDISFQYYHFPLRSIHPYAQKAAEAAECANDQDKFWEFIDMAFRNQANLREKDLKMYASELGLDRESFDACLESGAKEKEVESDFRLGRQKGVGGTPTFFINGEEVDDWRNLKQEIDMRLK